VLSTLIFLLPITLGLHTVQSDLDAFLVSEGNVPSLPFVAQMLNLSYSETTLIDLHLDASGIKVLLEMNMSNPSPFPMTINTIHFMVYCSNHSDLVLGRGESSQPITLSPNALGGVPLTVTITPEGMSHIFTYHLPFPQFILELTLTITHLEVEISIYTIPMTLMIKDSITFPLHYNLLLGM
jgi:hypothetical protein